MSTYTERIQQQIDIINAVTGGRATTLVEAVAQLEPYNECAKALVSCPTVSANYGPTYSGSRWMTMLSGRVLCHPSCGGVVVGAKANSARVRALTFLVTSEEKAGKTAEQLYKEVADSGYTRHECAVTSAADSSAWHINDRVFACATSYNNSTRHGSAFMGSGQSFVFAFEIVDTDGNVLAHFALDCGPAVPEGATHSPYTYWGEVRA